MPRIVLRDQFDPASNTPPGVAQPGEGVVSGEARRRPLSYWASTRRPLPSLSLVLPLMLAYELGVLWQGGASAGSIRTGADAWMRHILASLGLVDQWLPPLALVVILLGWQVASPRDWRFSPSILLVMLLESCVLAVALVGVSRLIDLGFSILDQERAPGALGGLVTSPDEPGSVDWLPGSGCLRRGAVPPRHGSYPLCFAPLPANPPDSGQYAGSDRFGVTLLAGSPRGYAR